jgi:hypothetical protein
MSTPPTEPLSETDEQRLLAAIDEYDADDNRYDEVFLEIGERLRAAQEAGKLDLAGLVTWKRSGQGAWVKPLLAMPETTVRATTRQAFAATGDLAVLAALRPLPGFGKQEAMATALMAAYDPREWAVLDRRARQALAALGRPVDTRRGMTVRYLETVRGLRDELAGRRPGITARDVDKGLFVLGV